MNTDQKKNNFLKLEELINSSNNEINETYAVTTIDQTQNKNLKILNTIFTDDNLMDEVVDQIRICFAVAKKKLKKSDDASSDFEYDSFDADKFNSLMTTVKIKVTSMNNRPSYLFDA